MRIFLTAAVSAVVLTSIVCAQPSASLEGTRFVFAVPQNYRSVATNAAIASKQKVEPPVITIGLSSTVGTQARIRCAGGIDTTVAVTTNAISYVSVDAASAEVASSMTSASGRSFEITSTAPIAVTVASVRYQTTESFRPWPVDMLGTEYRLMGYTKLAPVLISTATITAVEDDTEVIVEPSTPLTTDVTTIRLRAGQTFAVTAAFRQEHTSDLTGTLVRSSKPVSVVSGHTCAYVPARVEACNVLLEQMPPVSRWGDQHFASVPYYRSQGIVRVLAHHDGTSITVNGRQSVALEAGAFHEISSSEPLAILATKPVLVASFSQGYKNGDGIGDPSYAIVPPASMLGAACQIYSPLPIEPWSAAALITGPTQSIEAFRANIMAGAEYERQSADGNVTTIAVPLTSVAQIVQVPPGCSVSVWGNGKNDSFMAYDAWSYTPMWAPTRSR